MTRSLLSIAALRRLEAASIDASPPGTLMRRAADAVAGSAARLARTRAPRRPILALAGPGNNGGDALLAVLRLRERGYACRVLALDARGPADGEAAAAWQAARAAGLEIALPDALPALLSAAPIVIDGLFGIGLARPLDGNAGRIVAALSGAALPTVAIDVPSGIDAQTGAVVGGPGAPAIRADATVTMIADKPGLHTGPALDHVGRLELASLGLEAERARFLATAGPEAGDLFGADDAARAWRARARDSNKGSYGAVLVYGGAPGMRGAVLLAARGAQCLGAGKVSVGTPAGDCFDPGQPQWMSAPDEPAFGAYAAAAIGCGLGEAPTARRRLAAALADARALVLDADALNLLAAEPALADTRPAASPPRRVMTPHPLEAARLLGCSAAQVQADRRAAALQLARRYRMVALLKGAGSIVATPEGHWSIIDAGSPALATAGTGDVLAGMVATLLARGHDAAQAACLAAWLHGQAGMRFEAAQGHPEGLSAAELPALVRDALAASIGAGSHR